MSTTGQGSWTVDDDGRLYQELGELHTGVVTRLAVGDDGIVRAVSTPKPADEAPADESKAAE